MAKFVGTCRTRSAALIWLVMALSLWTADILPGLDPYRSVEQYVQEEWTAETGLPGNSIVAIVQTPDGFLWVADRRKLCRFDGLRFDSFHMFDTGDGVQREITAMQTDKQGNIWIGARGGGIFKYENEVFELFGLKEGLSSLFISCLFHDHNDNLWIGTDEGKLNLMSGKKITVYDKSSGLPESHIYCISDDSRGNLWVGVRGNGLYRFQNGKFVHIPVGGINVLDIVSISEDALGGLWLGSNRGLLKGDGVVFTDAGLGKGLSGHLINHIMPDKDRNLWIGSGAGLARIRRDINGGVAVDEALGDTVIRFLFEDQEKSIWIATDGRGLLRLRDGKIKTFSTESGLPHEYIVYMFEDRDKNLFIGAMDGLCRFSGGKLERSAMTVEFSESVVGPITQGADGAIWFGTYGAGLWRSLNSVRTHYSISNGLPSDTIISLCADSNGRIWIGADRGLIMIEKNIISDFRVHHELLKNEIYCIYEDKKQNLWIGASKGLLRLTGDTFSIIATPGVSGDFSVSFIQEDSEGFIWLATRGGGLLRLNGGNQSKAITTSHGLYSNSIYQIFEDRNGFFWMSCERGIFRVLRADLNKIADGAAKRLDFIPYGKNDGMKSAECSRWGQYSSIRASDGRLFFGTTMGVAIVDPENITIAKTAPPAILEKVIVNDMVIRQKKDRQIFEAIDYIQFHFRALTLIAPERIQFKFRLEGYEDKWTEVKSARIRMAHYKKLPAGNYTFQVISASADGVWSEQGTSFSFNYSPRFTHSLLFKILLILLILAICAVAAIAALKYRKFLKQRNKYKDSHLENDVAEKCSKKLLYVMDIDKIYRDDALSLQSLAKKIGVTPHILSQVINEQMSRNFSDFVNQYRIEEAKKLLQDANEDTSVLKVCYDVGFNSKSAFYRAFKKFTNLTPSQYQKSFKS